MQPDSTIEGFTQSLVVAFFPVVLLLLLLLRESCCTSTLPSRVNIPYVLVKLHDAKTRTHFESEPKNVNEEGAV